MWRHREQARGKVRHFLLSNTLDSESVRHFLLLLGCFGCMLIDFEATRSGRNRLSLLVAAPLLIDSVRL